MTLLLLAAAVAGIWLGRRALPVKGLSFLEPDLALEVRERETMTLLDVRDAVQYEENHISGSLNISVGRLRYVWEKELKAGEPVLIIANSRSASKRAARILRQAGFRRLYALSGCGKLCG